MFPCGSCRLFSLPDLLSTRSGGPCPPAGMLCHPGHCPWVPIGWLGGALSSVGLAQAGVQGQNGWCLRKSRMHTPAAQALLQPQPTGLATPTAHSSWPRSGGQWNCLAQVLQGVYFPQAPPQDHLWFPPSGLALVEAAGGLSGTPGQQGACVPH